MLLSHADEFVYAEWRFVRQTDGFDFASVDQLRECAQLLVHLLDDRRVILSLCLVVNFAEHGGRARWPMDLIQVYHVGVQAFEAGVAGAEDVLCTELIAAATHPRHAARRTGDFGGDDPLLAHPRILRKPAANDGFGQRVGFGFGRNGVHFGGVKEIHAAF